MKLSPGEAEGCHGPADAPLLGASGTSKIEPRKGEQTDRWRRKIRKGEGGMQSETDGNEEGERNGLSVFNVRLPVPADESEEEERRMIG